MCCLEDFPLKIICLACAFIIFADSVIFEQLLSIQDQVQKTVEPEVFHNCYKPQIRMRLVFTAYAINSALVCLMLTCALICYDEHTHGFQNVVYWITDYMFILFGPVLFFFCILGFCSLPGLAQDCQPDHIGATTHPSDISVLIISTLVSFCVLFIYAAQITSKLMNQELSNEMSLTYTIFASCLKCEKEAYRKEKDARYALLKRDSDADEDEGVFDQADEEEQQLASCDTDGVKLLSSREGEARRRESQLGYLESTTQASSSIAGVLDPQRFEDAEAVFQAADSSHSPFFH